jgi:hypothetical protein
LLMGMGLEEWGLWEDRDRAMIKGVIAVDCWKYLVMIDYDGVWCLVGLEPWVS